MTDLDDRLAIDDLLTRYAVAIDRKQWDALDDIFTPDATLDYTSAGGIRGRFPEVKRWLEEVLTPFEVTQHFVVNRLIEVRGDEAGARSYFFNPMGSRGSFFYVGGYYADHLRRTPAGWRIVERVEETAFMDNRPSP